MLDLINLLTTIEASQLRWVTRVRDAEVSVGEIGTVTSETCHIKTKISTPEFSSRVAMFTGGHDLDHENV